MIPLGRGGGASGQAKEKQLGNVALPVHNGLLNQRQCR